MTVTHICIDWSYKNEPAGSPATVPRLARVTIPEGTADRKIGRRPRKVKKMPPESVVLLALFLGAVMLVAAVLIVEGK